jgi:hypothetical protein
VNTGAVFKTAKLIRLPVVYYLLRVKCGCLLQNLTQLPYLKERIDHGCNVVLLAGIRLAVPQAGEKVCDSVHIASSFKSSRKCDEVNINKDKIPGA